SVTSCYKALMGKVEHRALLTGGCNKRASPAPLPPLIFTFPRQNLTAIKISFKTHGLAVFSLNKRGQPLIGYSSGPQCLKGSQGVAMVCLSYIRLITALGEL